MNKSAWCCSYWLGNGRDLKLLHGCQMSTVVEEKKAQQNINHVNTPYHLSALRAGGGGYE